MKYDNVKEIIEEIGKIIDECSALVRRLGEDVDSSVNDWAKMRVFSECAFYIRYRVEVCADLLWVEGRMENEKDVFWIKKIQKEHLESLNEEIESFIFRIRTWKFEDYRCRDWLKKMEDILLGIKEFYELACKE